MVVQDRRDRAGQIEGGRAGQQGGNYLLPAARAERGELPSGVRRPEMVHCLAEP